MGHVDACGSRRNGSARRGSLRAMGLVGLLRAALPGLTLPALLGVAACKGSGEACVTAFPGDTGPCAPLYPPTFDAIFAQTLAPTCAQPGAECHSAAGVQG